ncbi:transposase IS200 like protein [bacterium BMS3Bbin04]|nr:transposase IS200 like protein [bacterium BMS3Bbin04]
MVKYRRAFTDNPDQLYFLTIVTRERRRYFTTRDHYAALYRAWTAKLKNVDGDLEAFVFMPDHQHVVVKQGTISFSKTVGAVKRELNKILSPKGKSIWQERYWEHMIKNDDDYRLHVDYIHWNPVKHGHVNSSDDWPYSSFQSYVDRGIYTCDWFVKDDVVVPGSGGE